MKFDRVAAIPMGGLTIGIALSLTLDVPLIYPRLQGRESTVNRFLAGNYNAGETALVVDDDLEQGHNQLGTIGLLETVRLKVTDVMILLDREVGGKQALEAKGFRVHTILTVPEIIDALVKVRRMNPEQHKAILDWHQEKISKFHAEQKE
jgi:uridine monophosphate synthetase